MPIHKVNLAKEDFRESTPSAHHKEPTGSGVSGKAIMVVVIIVAALAVAGCAWMYLKYSAAKKQVSALATPQGQQELAKKEIQALLEKIGKHIVLPAGEEPTVATVTNADILKNEQAFYRDAQNGDKVIVYMQAKKAIIYNEAKDILVNVGPIFINEAASTTPEEGASN